MNIEFIWSEAKSSQNKKKHGISFTEAKECFYDEKALLIRDQLHSIDEERFVLIGETDSNKILVVIHVYWENEDLIRIISARKATRTEMNFYFKGDL